MSSLNSLPIDKKPYDWFLLFTYDKENNKFYNPSLYEEDRRVDISFAKRCHYLPEMLGFEQKIDDVSKTFFQNKQLQETLKSHCQGMDYLQPGALFDFKGHFVTYTKCASKRIPLPPKSQSNSSWEWVKDFTNYLYEIFIKEK
jgi:hypothetical protein